MELLSQRPMFSSEPSTKGFDLSSGNKWIYPENYPVREYQFNIVESALYHNTLVCLPTGLGKTFIAAVVMYNFWRWYPQGKIVFLAPTKPLVAQQIQACQDIMGISTDETIALTGTIDQKKRQSAWAEHRVIFATPQVFQNDLEKNILPSELVKCVVVDEAHKALGRHAYCEAIRLLTDKNKYFRVLGLSATPGAKLDAVQEVVRNLYITHLELRDDTSPDITPYINERKLDIVLVGLGDDLERFKDRYITIMDPHVRVLVDSNVLRGNTGNISKGRIFMIQKEYGQTGHKGHNHGQIMKTLTILMTMYHAYDLMVRHGLRAFYNFYQNHKDKFWLKDEPELMQVLEEIHYYLGPFPDVRPLPDGSLPEIPEDIRFGHNKFQKLKDILLRHFEIYEEKKEDTRAIVFVEYRDIVNEVYVLLLQSRPLLRPQKFVGQAGQKQRLQKLALEDFRSNKVNVLISTSVGEEGLDVGEVDLIVCFDISQVSPIRLVQRMGRTGRKRDGHIIVLVTDGKEHQTLKSAMSRRDSLNNKVLQSSGITNALHETSPRMVPNEFKPECCKMRMTVLQKSVATKGKGKTKEPKKPRKRAETAKKTKNSKTSDPSTSNNQPGQSSLMKFLKRKRDEAELDINDDIVDLTAKEPRAWTTPSSQQVLKNNNTIKLSNVKLLSSDNAAIEFLTLCTMKRSENEQTNIDKTKMKPYLPSYQENNERIDVFHDFEIPDLQILDCLTNIIEYVAPTCRNDKDELMICEDGYLPNYDYRAVYTLPQKSQSPVKDSKFEDLLDDSTNDTDVTMFDPQEVVKHDVFPASEKVDWAVNENDTKFEDLLDEWSDESTMSLETFESKKAAASEQQQHSKFEDIMNSSSNDSVETYYSPPKKTEIPVEQRLNIVHPIKMSSDIESRDLFQNPLQGPSSREPFEMMLDDESMDLLKDCAPKEICQLSLDEPDRRHFKVISNVQEAPTSGTPMSSVLIDLEPKKKPQFLPDEADSRSFKIVSETREASTSKPKSSTLNCPEPKEKSQFFAKDRDRRPFGIVTDEQEVFTHDAQKHSTLKDRDSNEKSQPLVNRLIHRHGKIVGNSQEASTSEIQSITEESPSSMLTISQTLEEIERIHSRASTLDESHVNNLDKGQRSAALPVKSRGTSNSRLNETSIAENGREEPSPKFNEHVEANGESDEDLFGTEDLLVDSDFEEQINSIERSLCTNVNTSNKEDSFDASVKATDIEPNECEILFVNETPKRVVKNYTPLSAKQSVREFNVNDFDWDSEDIEIANVKNSPSTASSDAKKKRRSDWNCEFGNDRHSPTVNSFVAEVNIDDLDWENDTCTDYSSTALPSGFKKNTVNNDRSRKNANNQNPPSTKSSVSEKSFDRIVWNHKTVKNTTIPSARETNFDNNDCNDGAENNSPLPYVKSSVPETIIEDCDWSSDFEVFSTPLKSSKKCQEVGNSRDFPKTGDNSPSNIAKNSLPSVRFGQGENTTGWISADRPKLRLALGKKISKNIHNNLPKKQTPKKPSPVKEDSDLENDFAVSRIETAVSKGAASDYFAKPSDHVDTATRPESLEMYNPRRVVSVPLSLRRNDVNKVSLEGLSDFAAPAKYMQQQQLQQKQQHRDPKNSRDVGVGRKKTTSLDLDTRKKKQHRKDRRRLRVRSEFVDDEAEVSSDECQTSGSSGVDEDLDGFVSYTQHVDDPIDMRAYYLQTVRSPLGPGKFLIRKPKSPNPNLPIYSQALPDEPNNYLYDSFCVREDDDDDDVFKDSETADEITILEEIELNLKNKKRKRGYSTDVGAKRKRKLLVPASEVSSSEDETEILRRQIQDESFVLKNVNRN